MKSLFLVFIFLFQTNSFSSETQNEFGVNFGWGAPFGFSVEYARYIEENQLLGTGLGFSLGGLKYGIEYKYFISAGESFAPYIGIAGSYATGLPEVTVSVNQDTALYKIPAGIAIGPRIGFKYAINSANMYFNVGYGIPLKEEKPEYIEGSTKESIHDFANLLQNGGLEVSGSVMWPF
jgi:hypothetical protein